MLSFFSVYKDLFYVIRFLTSEGENKNNLKEQRKIIARWLLIGGMFGCLLQTVSQSNSHVVNF